MKGFTLVVEGEAAHEREALSYSAERSPEIGQTITVDGVTVVVENVLPSIKPGSDAVMVEAPRAEEESNRDD